MPPNVSLLLLLLAARCAGAALSQPVRIEPLRWVTDTIAAVYDGPYDTVQLGADVELRDSPGKGRGVYALRRIEPLEIIGRYTGTLRTVAEFEAAVSAGENSGDYMFLIEGTPWLIDGEDPARAGWPRYINHSVRKQNVEALVLEVPVDVPMLGWSFAVPTGIVAFQPMRPIAEGEELLIDYGAGYWDARVPGGSWRRFVIDYL